MPQRYAILALAAVGIIIVAQRNRSWTSHIEDPSLAGKRAHELIGRLDPNTADATALVAIPGLGERRSRDIVTFREKNYTDGNPIVYREVKDLMRVRGIGPALSRQMAPYLVFPNESEGDSVGSSENDRDISIDANR